MSRRTKDTTRQGPADAVAARACGLPRGVAELAHDVLARPKHENLAELVRALNLSQDSFVLADDNPYECGLVRRELPGVAVVDLDVRDFYPRHGFARLPNRPPDRLSDDGTVAAFRHDLAEIAPIPDHIRLITDSAE